MPGPYLPDRYYPDHDVLGELTLRPLSPRQSLVARGVADGLSSVEIARRLCITTKAVRDGWWKATRRLALGQGDARLLLAQWVRRQDRRFVPVVVPVPGTSRNIGRIGPREWAVLACLVGTGGRNAEIARDLYISESTVKEHIGRLLRHTECRDRTQLAMWGWYWLGRLAHVRDQVETQARQRDAA